MTAQTIELSPERTLTVIKDGLIHGYMVFPDFTDEEQERLQNEVKGSLFYSAGHLALLPLDGCCSDQMICVVEPMPGDKRIQKRIIGILATSRIENLVID